LRIVAPLACFTRPEFKVERLTYPVITPSAARGILESVLWKPAIRWRVDRIKVLAPISYTAFRRNEVSHIVPRIAETIISGNRSFDDFRVEDHRQQRNTVALRNVDYVIEARLIMTARAGPGDNIAKFTDMFRRRIAKGQHFQQPYLGCREFVGNVMAVGNLTPEPIDENLDLGRMLWDVEFGRSHNRPIFFDAQMHHGIIEVPSDPEISKPVDGGDPCC
jgi:CRISPR-associated protein Cas5d